MNFRINEYVTVTPADGSPKWKGRIESIHENYYKVEDLSDGQFYACEDNELN